MMDQDLDDTHLCIKCNITIVGLENYIHHRKINCVQKPTQVVPVEHSYGTFSFAETSAKHTFNYELENPPTSQSEKEASADPNKTLSESYDYNYGLGADLFFSSLELQSSSKQKSVPSTSGKVSAAVTTSRIRTRKTTAAIIANHDDVWINTHAGGSDKLLKAVNDISGTKKVDSMFGLMRFHPDSPEPFQDDDDDDDEDYHIPSRMHTGGKWKPTERHPLINSSPHWDDRDQWEIVSDEQHPANANEDFTDDLSPPPSYTKGKWVPGTKIGKVDYKPDPSPGKLLTEQFWCNTCNRKLASRVIYERHLKSNLHLKRSLPENELDEASRSMSVGQIMDQSKRIIKPSIYLNQSIYATRIRTNKTKLVSPSCTTSVATVNRTKRSKRNRRSYYINCEVCKTRLPIHLLGKHLISHYHFRRMRGNGSSMILTHIHKIVRQSPFQCSPCRFYANTEQSFMAHWNSATHSDVTEGPGRFWCNFCQFECEDNNQMRRHLTDDGHREVSMAINRSVPIIIRKRAIIKCSQCHQEFQYNMALRQHALKCNGLESLNMTASNAYQSKHRCPLCQNMCKSLKALQQHIARFHAIRHYYCNACNLTFASANDSKQHRSTTLHKISSSRGRKKNLARRCTVCHAVLPDILKLREHRRTTHPNELYSCSGCGKTFVLVQELCRHTRDKLCSLKIKQSATATERISMPIDHGVTPDPTLPTHTSKECIATVDEATTSGGGDSTSTIVTIEWNDQAVTVENSNEKQDQSSASTLSYGCDDCDFRTQSEAESLFHKILHKYDGEADKLACSLCDKSFGKTSLRIHLKQHTNERNFKCTLCAIAFARKANLTSHIKRKHSERKTVVVKSPLRAHSCSICSKSFTHKHLLEQHFHCHRNQVATKSFPCTVDNCLYAGRSAAELRNHRFSHMNEKNFCCTFDGCKYRGKTMVLLKRHSKVHDAAETIVKEHRCAHCQFQTRVPGHLKRHLRTHTGEKPYKCPHCQYACNTSENLRKHVMVSKKHPGRHLYECTRCDSSAEIVDKFASNSFKEYNFHLVTVHNVKSEKK